MQKLKDAGFWLAMLVAFTLAIVGALGRCSPAVEPLVTKQKVDSVLVIRHDTIKVINDSLRTKIVFVDTGRIDTVERILDVKVPPIGDENICIAENQLRQCVKCQDSLEAYKKIVAIDSVAIDSLSKLAKTPDTIKACSMKEQAKSFGLGTLFGITLRSLF